MVFGAIECPPLSTTQEYVTTKLICNYDNLTDKSWEALHPMQVHLHQAKPISYFNCSIRKKNHPCSLPLSLNPNSGKESIELWRVLVISFHAWHIHRSHFHPIFQGTNQRGRDVKIQADDTVNPRAWPVAVDQFFRNLMSAERTACLPGHDLWSRAPRRIRSSYLMAASTPLTDAVCITGQ